jgi:serine phosphatase RsbU (regulator of sigma subunit)
MVADIASGLGATDVVVHLIDFGQTSLEPLPDRRPHAEMPHSEPVATSMAGRAFISQEPTVAARPGGYRVWVPIKEGSDRTGVLALTVTDASDGVLQSCVELGAFTGYLIASHARFTDLYNLYRRRRSLSLAASMQWDLLPPLVFKAARVSVAGLLEPAYDVGGDCFDYALNGHVLEFAMFDAMGHGIQAALMAALVVGCYRHGRREGTGLARIHADLDRAMAEHFPGLAFATGTLARIDLETGEMTWTNAGHPNPMLIRDGRVVSEMQCPPTTPWGLGVALDNPVPYPPVATAALEPGDSVMFYTDGIIEARMADGSLFGQDRLADLAGRHSSELMEPGEIVRHLIRAVTDEQEHHLRDDATIVIARWTGP